MYHKRIVKNPGLRKLFGSIDCLYGALLEFYCLTAILYGEVNKLFGDGDIAVMVNADLCNNESRLSGANNAVSYFNFSHIRYNSRIASFGYLDKTFAVIEFYDRNSAGYITFGANMKTSCIVIVGKPGAGKSSIGSELAKLIGGTYLSLGGFMRDVLQIPDPHIGVDKNVVYEELQKYLAEQKVSDTLVLDCHPYPEDDLNALQAFVRKPSLALWAVVHVQADDAVALNRLGKRARPGQAIEDRLKYFNDNQHFIEELMKYPLAIEVENNVDSSDIHTFKNIAEEISRQI